jgi:hypothetical protein
MIDANGGWQEMQALYLLALDPIAETTADPNSVSFRRAIWIFFNSI